MIKWLMVEWFLDHRAYLSYLSVIEMGPVSTAHWCLLRHLEEQQANQSFVGIKNGDVIVLRQGKTPFQRETEISHRLL